MFILFSNVMSSFLKVYKKRNYLLESSNKILSVLWALPTGEGTNFNAGKQECNRGDLFINE